MKTTVSAHESNGHETPMAASVKLTIVGRSAPYVVRKASGAKMAKAPEVHHIRTEQESHPQVIQDTCYSVRIPAAPLVANFATQRLAVGLRSLIGVILGLGIGGYLATEVSTTPPLHLKVAFVSGVCILLGLGLVPMAVRDLIGSLRVDSFGIRVTPGVFGFSIPWDELDRWTIEGPAFRFHCRKTDVTHFLSVDHLSAGERQALIDVLRSCTHGSEMRKSPALQPA